MEIVKHPLCTAVIGAPSDMQDGSCSGLPVAYHTDEYGTWALSFWKPDDEELATLANGGGIVLHVRAHARQHPVIGMATYPAPDSECITCDDLAAANAEGHNSQDPNCSCPSGNGSLRWPCLVHPPQTDTTPAGNTAGLTDREIMEEWDRQRQQGEANDTPFLRVIVGLARHFMTRPATNGAPAQEGGAA